MTRLWVIVVALAACVLCIEAASFFAGQAGPWLQSHMVARWLLPLCNLFLVGCVVMVALRRRKAAAEDERMTPQVRRDPKTGTRQL